MERWEDLPSSLEGMVVGRIVQMFLFALLISISLVSSSVASLKSTPSAKLPAPGRQWNGNDILAILLFQSWMKILICDS